MKAFKPSNEKLFEALTHIDSVDEARDFLDDVCTIKEIEEMSQRLEAAKLLLKGMTYDEVIKKTGISSATLSRVSRCIRYGNGGYKKIIDKIEKKAG